MLSCVAAGNAFVQLFLQSKPKYQLTNRKLQYLLCIAQMARLGCGKVLFSEDIKNQKYEFTLDCIADTFIYNKNIVDGTAINYVLDISKESLTLPIKTRRIYELEESLSDEDKALLIDVFITFGGYEETLLEVILDELTPLRALPLFKEIPKEAITEFFVSYLDSDDFNLNEVFCFVRDIYLTENPITEDIPEEEPTFVPVVPEEAVVEAVHTEYLKDVSSINNTFVGKEYSVLIELINDMSIKDIFVLSTKDNSPVKGTFKKVSDRIYSFTFLGVPSDIKISVNC